MAEGSGRSDASNLLHRSFPRRLDEWLQEHRAVLLGLSALRAMAREAAAAVDAVLDVRELKRTRLCWELWLALIEDEVDAKPEALLRARLSEEDLSFARCALWGTPDDSTPPGLHLA